MLDQGSANRASRARKQFAVLKRLWIRQSAQMATRCSRWAMLPKWILKPGLDSQIKRRHTRAKVHPVYLVVCLLIALVVLVTMARGSRELGPISLLAIGLVFTTTIAVMLAAHFLLGFLWGPAFVLGAAAV
jgi:hypothetical protein